MARVLVALRLAIERRARGRGAVARAWFVARWVGAMALGLFLGDAVAGLDAMRTGVSDLVLVVLFTMVFLVWVIVPVIKPQLADQTVDPERLEQFPLSAREQVLGLLLGSLIAPTALLTFLLAAGGAFAADENRAARVAAFLAAMVFAVLCVAASRSIQAAMAGGMRSRRGRDAVILLGGLLLFVPPLLSQQTRDIATNVSGLENDTLQAVLSWLPPGAVAATLTAVRDGRWLAGSAYLGVALAGIVGFVTLWTWALQQRVRGSSGRVRSSRRWKASEDRPSLVPFPITVLPFSVATAAAAQQLRYYFFRSPKAVQSVVFPPVVGIIAAQSFIDSFGLLVASALFVAVAMEPGFEAFNYDDAGVSFLMTTGAPLEKVLLGKVLTPLVYTVPLLAAYVMTQATVRDQWAEADAVFLGALAVAVFICGVAAVISVRFARSAYRVVSGAGQLLGPLVGVIVTMGFAWLIRTAQARDLVDPVVVSLLAVIMATGIAIVGLRAGGRWLDTHTQHVAQQFHA